MDRTRSGGHRAEGEGQRTMKGNGTGNNKKGMGEGYGARQGV